MELSLKSRLKKAFYQKPVVWPLLETAQGLEYAFNYSYFLKTKQGRQQRSIKELNIEFASQCNLRCSFCALDHSKPKELITNDLLTALFDQLLADPNWKSIEVINLHNGGETLLHPQRMELFALIKAYEHQARANNLHWPKIHLTTNGLLLRKQLAQQMMELNLFDRIDLSLDGGTPESYEAIRKNANWGKVYQNILGLWEARNKYAAKTQLAAIGCIPEPYPLNTDWMHSDFRHVFSLLDSVELRRFHNWAGEIEAIETKNKWWKIGCSMMMHQLVVVPNGDVTVCCNDLNGKAVVGNLFHQNLEEIYLSPERQRLLSLMLRGKKDEIELCRGCETF